MKLPTVSEESLAALRRWEETWAEVKRLEGLGEKVATDHPAYRVFEQACRAMDKALGLRPRKPRNKCLGCGRRFTVNEDELYFALCPACRAFARGPP